MTEAMKTAVSTALNGIKADTFDMTEASLPIALGIMGISLVIGIVIKIVKRVASK